VPIDFESDLFPPGEYIRDELDARGWTQEDLADIMRRPATTVSQIINGAKKITPHTAQQLAAAFGTTAELWLNLESAYRLARERQDNAEVAQRARIYDKCPIADMVRRHWIPECETTNRLEAEVLRFHDIPSLDDTPRLESAARKSTDYSKTTPAQIAWLCRVRQLARTLTVPRFSPTRLDEHMKELQALTTSDQEVRKVPALLSNAGIRFVVVEHLPRTRIDGATLWLKRSPVIALSLRYGRIDWFWHTLIHELSHVRHKDGLSLDDALVGADRKKLQDKVEQRADEEASAFLVPTSELESFILRTRPRFSKERIIRFANLHRIHPGIIVGQLQFRGEIRYSHSREMLVDVREILIETALTDGWGHTPLI